MSLIITVYLAAHVYDLVLLFKLLFLTLARNLCQRKASPLVYSTCKWCMHFLFKQDWFSSYYSLTTSNYLLNIVKLILLVVMRVINFRYGSTDNTLKQLAESALFVVVALICISFLIAESYFSFLLPGQDLPIMWNCSVRKCCFFFSCHFGFPYPMGLKTTQLSHYQYYTAMAFYFPKTTYCDLTYWK